MGRYRYDIISIHIMLFRIDDHSVLEYIYLFVAVLTLQY